jgi:hypothetical protein
MPTDDRRREVSAQGSRRSAMGGSTRLVWAGADLGSGAADRSFRLGGSAACWEAVLGQALGKKGSREGGDGCILSSSLSMAGRGTEIEMRLVIAGGYIQQLLSEGLCVSKRASIASPSEPVSRVGRCRARFGARAIGVSQPIVWGRVSATVCGRWCWWGSNDLTVRGTHCAATRDCRRRPHADTQYASHASEPGTQTGPPINCFPRPECARTGRAMLAGMRMGPVGRRRLEASQPHVILRAVCSGPIDKSVLDTSSSGQCVAFCPLPLPSAAR